MLNLYACASCTKERNDTKDFGSFSTLSDSGRPRKEKSATHEYLQKHPLASELSSPIVVDSHTQTQDQEILHNYVDPTRNNGYPTSQNEYEDKVSTEKPACSDPFILEEINKRFDEIINRLPGNKTPPEQLDFDSNILNSYFKHYDGCKNWPGYDGLNFLSEELMLNNEYDFFGEFLDDIYTMNGRILSKLESLETEMTPKNDHSSLDNEHFSFHDPVLNDFVIPSDEDSNIIYTLPPASCYDNECYVNAIKTSPPGGLKNLFAKLQLIYHIADALYENRKPKAKLPSVKTRERKRKKKSSEKKATNSPEGLNYNDKQNLSSINETKKNKPKYFNIRSKFKSKESEKCKDLSDKQRADLRPQGKVKKTHTKAKSERKFEDTKKGYIIPNIQITEIDTHMKEKTPKRKDSTSDTENDASKLVSDKPLPSKSIKQPRSNDYVQSTYARITRTGGESKFRNYKKNTILSVPIKDRRQNRPAKSILKIKSAPKYK